MKNKFWILGLSILLLSFGAFQLCTHEDEKQTVTITTDEIKGTFEPQIQVIHEVIPGTKEIIERNRKESVASVDAALLQRIAEYEKQLNDLRTEFAALDCNDKTDMFNEVTQLRAFNSHFEDDHLELNISGVVQGYVHELTPSYTIKHKTFDVDLPKPKLKTNTLYVFGSFGANKELNHTQYGGGLALAKKHNITQIRYEKIANQDYISASLGIPLWSW